MSCYAESSLGAVGYVVASLGRRGMDSNGVVGRDLMRQAVAWLGRNGLLSPGGASCGKFGSG